MLDPKEFAVLPWGWTPGDPAALKEIRECGFNLAGFVAPEHLDQVHEAGLKGIVSTPDTHVVDAEAGLCEADIGRRVEALVERTGRHPATFGYYLRDEPKVDMYPALKRWVAAYRSAAPDARAYINLYPNYANMRQIGVADYETYLENFVRDVQPEFISYDHYALMDDGSLRDGYFQNLESVRATAMRHLLPFWNIVLSNAHFHYAEPSDAGLHFQLYTTLAYGARGISYFTYFSPAIGNYRLAPVDPFGNKTSTWYQLRNINQQLHRLAPVYLSLESRHVFHHPDVPKGCSGIETSRWLSKVSGGSLLVGEFEGPGGRPFVMVVNKSLKDSVAVSVDFKTPGKIQKVSAYTGQTGPWRGEDVWLAAGQGALLCL